MALTETEMRARRPPGEVAPDVTLEGKEEVAGRVSAQLTCGGAVPPMGNSGHSFLTVWGLGSKVTVLARHPPKLFYVLNMVDLAF